MPPIAIRIRPGLSWVVIVAGLVVGFVRTGQANPPQQVWKPATALTNLTLSPAADGVMAVVETDGLIDHRIYVFEESNRVVLDILNVRNGLDGLRPMEPHPFLQHVKSEEASMTAYDPEARGRTFARLTFELKQPAWHSLSVEPGRLELGLHPKGSGKEAALEEAPTPVPEPETRSESIPTPELEPTPANGSAAADDGFSAANFIEPADVSPDLFFGPKPVGSTHYQLGPDDVLEVRVFELEQLNRTVRVEADGAILLPLIGPVSVAGKTAPEAAQAVAAKLRGEFVDDPQVTVMIKEYLSRRVSLLGAVAKPGKYPLIGPSDLLELLASAEGLGTGSGSVLFVFRKLPDGRSARLSVPLHELLVLGQPRWNIRLEPGDVVSVPPEDAVSVSVVGSVKNPGVYKLPAGKGATLLRAIALAGGLGPRASKGIQVKRQSPSGEETIVKVDLGDIMAGKTSDFVLREGDVVIVNQSFF